MNNFFKNYSIHIQTFNFFIFPFIAYQYVLKGDTIFWWIILIAFPIMGIYNLLKIFKLLQMSKLRKIEHLSLGKCPNCNSWELVNRTKGKPHMLCLNCGSKYEISYLYNFISIALVVFSARFYFDYFNPSFLRYPLFLVLSIIIFSLISYNTPKKPFKSSKQLYLIFHP